MVLACLIVLLLGFAQSVAHHVDDGDAGHLSHQHTECIVSGMTVVLAVEVLLPCGPVVRIYADFEGEAAGASFHGAYEARGPPPSS